MKTLLLLLVVALAGFLTGCVTRGGSKSGAPLLIQPLLDRIVPADFRGDFDGGERGQYITIEIIATDLRKNEAGSWTWAGLKYRRTLNVPLFSGLPYKQEGWYTLTAPTQDARPK